MPLNGFAGLLSLCFGFLLICCRVPALSANVQPDWQSQKEQALAAARSGAFEKADALLHAAIASLGNARDNEAAGLWNQLGLVHETEFKLEQAKQDFVRAIDILNAEREHPSQLQEAVALNNLGSVLQAEGDFKIAEQWFRRSYSVLVDNHLLNSSSAGSVLSNLALDLQQQGRFTESADLFQRALTTFHTTNAENTPEFVRCITNFGLLKHETGHFREAVLQYQRALEIQRALPPSAVTARDQAYVLSNLGLALGELGMSIEAGADLLKAIDLEKSDPLHPDPRLPETLNYLAGVENGVGDLDLVKRYAEEALETAVTFRPKDDGLRAGILSNLGIVETKERNYSGARELYGQAVELWLKSVWANSPKYSATLSNIGELESIQGHHKEAKQTLSKCLQIDQDWLGPEHPQVAKDLANIAAQLYFEKKYNQAIDLYSHAREIDESTLGPVTQEVATIWRNLAITYQTAKRYAESKDAYVNAIHIFEFEAFSGSAPQLGSCYRSYAYVLRKLERFSEAEEADLKASKIEVRSAIEADKHAGTGTGPGAAGFRL